MSIGRRPARDGEAAVLRLILANTSAGALQRYQVLMVAEGKMAARYVGTPQVEFQPNGRNVKLLADLIFYDPQETRWSVPAGAVVDGASIPSVFWPVIGGPFEGKYRDASIIHDWFCDKRTRTWQATHRVFYDGMLVSGVSQRKAKVMYFAVRWRGPRWEDRVSLNTNLDIGTGYNFVSRGNGDLLKALAGVLSTKKSRPSIIPNPGATFDEARQQEIVAGMMEKIERDDPSVDELDYLADGLTSGS
jgi:hypothetical protein